MRPPPLNLLGLVPLARPPGWCQLPPTLGCPPGPGGVSTDLQTVLVETSKAIEVTTATSTRTRGRPTAHLRATAGRRHSGSGWAQGRGATDARARHRLGAPP